MQILPRMSRRGYVCELSLSCARRDIRYFGPSFPPKVPRYDFLMKKLGDCDTRNLRGDYHTLGSNQQKSKLSSVETQNSQVRWQRQHFTVLTENDAFKHRSDRQLPRAVEAAISVSRLRNHEKQQHTNLHSDVMSDSFLLLLKTQACCLQGC